MTTVTTIARGITGGVDTHPDVHVAAALDERGAPQGCEELRDHAGGLPGPPPVGPCATFADDGLHRLPAGRTRANPWDPHHAPLRRRPHRVRVVEQPAELGVVTSDRHLLELDQLIVTGTVVGTAPPGCTGSIPPG